MKKGDISFQLILLILAVIGLIVFGSLIISKSNVAKEFFAKLIGNLTDYIKNIIKIG